MADFRDSRNRYNASKTTPNQDFLIRSQLYQHGDRNQFLDGNNSSHPTLDSIRSISYATTNCIEQSPSWEADSRSADREISCLLWNPNVRSRIHNSSPLDSVLKKVNPVQTLTPYLLGWTESFCVFEDTA
jgi:hypothetical protein